MTPIIVTLAILLFILKCKDALVDRAARELARDARRGRQARNFVLCVVGIVVLYCFANRKHGRSTLDGSPAHIHLDAAPDTAPAGGE